MLHQHLHQLFYKLLQSVGYGTADGVSEPAEDRYYDWKTLFCLNEDIEERRLYNRGDLVRLGIVNE